MTGFRVSAPQVRFEPQPVQAGGYFDDMSDADFADFIPGREHSGPEWFEPQVIGLDGSAAQGRWISKQDGEAMGGYIDPATGLIVRSAGARPGVNAAINRSTSAEMARRKALRRQAMRERQGQSALQQGGMTVVRGGVDGAAFGAFPTAAAGVKSLVDGTSFADNRALENFQVERDKIEHPYLRTISEIGGAMAAPNPFAKARAAALLGKVGKDVAWDGVSGMTQGFLTTEGDAADRMRGALGGGASNIAFGRLADGAVTIGGRLADRMAPGAWRMTTGYDMPSAELFGEAAARDGTTLNGLAMVADTPVGPAGPHLSGLAQAVADTRAAATGGLRDIPSATVEGQAFRSPAAALDPYSLQRLEEGLAGDKAAIDQMIVNGFIEAQRRKSGDIAKKAGAKIIELGVGWLASASAATERKPPREKPPEDRRSDR